MDDEEYYATMARYEDHVAAEKESSDYFSNDYSHEDQVWPDYLDFMDEWKERQKELLLHAKRDFMRRFFVIPKRKMTCGRDKHTHVFVAADEYTGAREQVLLEDTGIFPNNACWADEIFISMEQVIGQDHDGTIIKLAQSAYDFVNVITACRLVKEGLPPKYLSFEAYRETWWGQETSTRAEGLLMSSGMKLGVAEHITRGRTALQYQQKAPEVLDVSPDVISANHGFHRVFLTYHQPRELLHKMNQIRRLGGGEPFDSDVLAKEMARCERCKHHTQEARHPQMLVYAPPGMGKTTALDNGDLTGIDTDWLIRYASFNDTVGWFWLNGFSIITNNIDIINTCNTKVYGFLNPSKLRRLANGKYMTPKKDVVRLFHHLGSDGLLFNGTREEYLSHHSLRIMVAANIYHYMLDRVWCGEEGKTRYRYPIGATLHETISMIASGRTTRIRSTQVKRAKWREKRKDRKAVLNRQE